MFKKLIVLAFFGIASNCYAIDRPVAGILDNGYFDVIEKAGEAASLGDIDEYLSCFAKVSKKQKKKVSEIFLSKSFNVVIVDKKLINENDASVEVGIRYKVSTNDEENHLYSSFVFLKKVDGEWKLLKEKIIERKQISSCRSCAVAKNQKEEDVPKNNNCANGQCFLR